MTLDQLLTDLAACDPEAPLIFATEEGAIGGGYHVTEFKLARVESIDSGGRRGSFDEALLQLLDGAGGARMRVGKFAAIAQRSRETLRGLGEAPLRVEFAHGNAGKAIYELEPPAPGPHGVGIALVGEAALCKPAQAAMPGCGAARGEAQRCC
ncbi:MAG: DUF6428 family protein [Pseudomonadota bacterium]